MISAVLILILFFLIYYKFYIYGKVKNFPQFPGHLPLLGNLLSVINRSHNLHEVINDISDYLLKNNGRCCFSIGPVRYYMFSDPEECTTLLNLTSEKHKTSRLTKSWIGDGLATTSTATWAKRHKLLYPMFQQQVINGFIPVFNQQSRRLVQRFAPEVGKGAFDHQPFLFRAGLETITQNVFGADIQGETTEVKEYYKALDGILSILTTKITSPLYMIDSLFKYSRLKIKEDECLKIINQYSDKFIQLRKAEFQNNIGQENIGAGNSDEFKPFISFIIKVAMENNFSDEQIRCEANTLLFTGYETSAVTLVHALMLLGHYPEVQEKAYKELQEVFGNSYRDVDKYDLIKLVYIEAILREVLRCIPPAYFIGRTNLEEMKLGDLTIPAQSSCFVHVHALMRHPSWGPATDQFIPERWLDPAKLPANANILNAGFGIGKRSCIGKTFALMSMKISLAHILRRYKVFADFNKLKFKFEIITKPASGQHIILESR